MRLGKVELGKSPKVVASFVPGAKTSAIQGVRRSGIEIAELRVDAMKRPAAAAVLKEIKRFKKFSLIATLRSKKEGGAWKFSEEERLSLFKKILPSVQAVDIELSSEKILKNVVSDAKRRKKVVIISYHNFKSTPPLSALKKIVKHAKRSGADLVKIAVTAKRAQDVKIMTELTLACRRQNLVTISMGERAAASRAFLPVIGSLLAYAHAGKATAPGQMDTQGLFSLLGNIYFSAW